MNPWSGTKRSEYIYAMLLATCSQKNLDASQKESIVHTMQV